MSSLPLYTLSITDGQYPFKNAHIAKIFDISVEQQVALSQLTHLFLEAYHALKSPLLILMLEVTKTSPTSLKLGYEYIETPLPHYIRRYIHDSLQLRMEKLVM